MLTLLIGLLIGIVGGGFGGLIAGAVIIGSAMDKAEGHNKD